MTRTLKKRRRGSFNASSNFFRDRYASRIGLLALVCAGTLVVTHCASAGRATKVTEREPFALHIRPAVKEVAEYETITLAYELENKTDREIAGCLAARDAYLLKGVKGAMTFLEASLPGPPPEKFVLPKHTRLSWQAPIRIPDVGAGAAQLIGIADIGCGWRGSVLSVPFEMTVR